MSVAHRGNLRHRAASVSLGRASVPVLCDSRYEPRSPAHVRAPPEFPNIGTGVERSSPRAGLLLVCLAWLITHEIKIVLGRRMSKIAPEPVGEAPGELPDAGGAAQGEPAAGVPGEPAGGATGAPAAAAPSERSERSVGDLLKSQRRSMKLALTATSHVNISNKVGIVPTGEDLRMAQVLHSGIHAALAVGATSTAAAGAAAASVTAVDADGFRSLREAFDMSEVSFRASIELAAGRQTTDMKMIPTAMAAGKSKVRTHHSSLITRWPRASPRSARITHHS